LTDACWRFFFSLEAAKERRRLKDIEKKLNQLEITRKGE
jgi:hypothetical protein